MHGAKNRLHISKPSASELKSGLIRWTQHRTATACDINNFPSLLRYCNTRKLVYVYREPRALLLTQPIPTAIRTPLGRRRREGFCALLSLSNSFWAEKTSDGWHIASSAK